MKPLYRILSMIKVPHGSTHRSFRPEIIRDFLVALRIMHYAAEYIYKHYFHYYCLRHHTTDRQLAEGGGVPQAVFLHLDLNNI